MKEVLHKFYVCLNIEHKLCLITPKNIFFEESKPAAYNRAILVSFLSQIIRHANLEIVLAAADFLF